VQEAYFRVWHKASSFDPALASPISWMASIVRYCAIDVLRKQKLELVEYGDESGRVPADGPDPAQEVEVAQWRGIILDALRRMAPAKRDLVFLVYFREQSLASLARTHGIPTGTIKSRLRRSLIELRQSIQRKEEQAHPIPQLRQRA
jgi:RNA polymerase sigma-70 factor (ECF subfamily)